MSRHSVLVTGAAGFIGSHLCEALLAAGHRVIGLDNFDPYYSPARKQRNLTAALQSDAFALVEGDIRDQGLLASVFGEYQPQAVAHLAARPGVRASLADPLGYAQVNVQGTIALLCASVQAGVSRFIYTSSSSVYGAGPLPFDEDQPPCPLSPYAVAKYAGELYCRTFHGLYGLPMICLRLFTVYGPRMRPDLAVAKFTRALLVGKPLPIYGDGSAARDLTYVADVVAAIQAALGEKGEEAARAGAVINIGSGVATTVRELVGLLEEATGRRATLHFEPPAAGEVACTRASVERARRLLAWQPRTNLREGIAQFITWYEAEG